MNAIVDTTLKSARRVGKRMGKASRDLPLWLLFLAGTLAIEGYGASYALDSAVKEHLIQTAWGAFPMMGLVNAAMILTIASMASFLLYRASERRADPRKAVKQTSLTPTLLALALMTWPITQFAGGIAWERQKAVFVNVTGSRALKDAQAVLADPMSGQGERFEAREIVKQATKPARGPRAMWESEARALIRDHGEVG